MVVLINNRMMMMMAIKMQEDKGVGCGNKKVHASFTII